METGSATHLRKDLLQKNLVYVKDIFITAFALFATKYKSRSYNNWLNGWIDSAENFAQTMRVATTMTFYNDATNAKRGTSK